MADSFDLVVIGAGPGGYVCAIRAAQLGMRVACIDKRGLWGGTCLNIGCIPSKALLHASELYHQAQNELANFGVKTSGVKLDLDTMMSHKDEAVKQLTGGIDFLFNKNKVEGIAGEARIAAPGKVEVNLNDGGTRSLEAKDVVIATGSEPMPLPGVDIDEKDIVSSTGALSLAKVPGHLLVVGGGYIGLELGSVWGRLGAKVTVVEFLDRITPGLDGEVAKQFERLLKRQGFVFKLGHKVTGAKTAASGVDVTVEPVIGGGDSETISADVVLVCIGRRAFTEGLGLDELGVERNDRGCVVTDGHFHTNVPGIHAIGDAIEGPMLAHKAEEEGVALAESLAGQAGHVNYDVIPAVVYTNPEVASVGKTEEELKEAGVAYRTGKFPFTANARAKINDEGDGFVKMLADAKTDRVLGVHIIGPDAGNMIAELALAMEFGASAEDIARTCHAHPTLPEAIKEAALAVDGRPLHI